MNIKIDRNDLFPLIGQVQGILERKKITPIHSCLLLEAKDSKGGKGGGSLNIFASGWELSFQASLPCKVNKEGRAVVNGKSLFDILRESPPGKVSLEEQENRKLSIKVKGSVFHLFGLDPEDFPVSAPVEASNFQKISVREFLNTINKTIFCVSLDEARYHLTGVFCERIKNSFTYRFASTDGYRMAFCDLRLGKKNFVSFEDGVIIPRKGLQEIKKMISLSESEEGEEKEEEFELALEKSRAVARYKNQILSVRLIDGSFPPYQALLPKRENGLEVSLNRREFESALRRINVLTTDRFKAVNFLFKDQKLTLEADTPELGHGTTVLPCRHEKGKSMKIRFNCFYILDAVQVLTKNKVEAFLKDASSGMIVQEEGNKNYTAVVMPMTLREKGEAPETTAEADPAPLVENETENETENKI